MRITDEELGQWVADALGERYPIPTDVDLDAAVQQRQPPIRHRITAMAVAACVVALIGVVAAVVAVTGRSERAATVPHLPGPTGSIAGHQPTATQTPHQRGSRPFYLPPRCAHLRLGQATSVLVINVKRTRQPGLARPCYAAPAGTPLRLTFRNNYSVNGWQGRRNDLPDAQLSLLPAAGWHLKGGSPPGFVGGSISGVIFTSRVLHRGQSQTATISPLTPGRYVLYDTHGPPYPSTLIIR